MEAANERERRERRDGGANARRRSSQAADEVDAIARQRTTVDESFGRCPPSTARALRWQTLEAAKAETRHARVAEAAAAVRREIRRRDDGTRGGAGARVARLQMPHCEVEHRAIACGTGGTHRAAGNRRGRSARWSAAALFR
jgi:hypothetical protein